MISVISKLTGPDHTGLDRDLHKLLVGDAADAIPYYAIPKYTASLDCAMKLIPAGCGIELTRYWVFGGERWSCRLSTGQNDIDVDDALTPIVAVLIASLKARGL